CAAWDYSLNGYIF
nr:immunoglobulin light chain junction region [Macaca mulatta]MPO10012.1 immunoglobulin light chain junction region [Macaca mulatta]MPO11601.1 immunoglobulin light chain junction region [Macaca mulatta]MPO11969.1 immunoglobulin light chain junction region [Macaca mulatta]